MANISDAVGIMTFYHPVEPPTLINEVINETNELYYGQLMVGDESDFMWGEDIGFASSGRWTMYNTLENFFDIFNGASNQELAKRVDKLIIEFEFTDYEPGTSYFADIRLKIQAQYDKNTNHMHTIILSEEFNDVEASSEMLVENEHVEWAVDTYTSYGIEELREDVKEVLKYNPPIREAYTGLHPQMETLLKNFDKISTDEWLQVFKDQEADDILYDVEGDPYYYEMMFVDSDIFNHPIIKSKI